MTRTLNVIDAMMGMGKTTAMIRYINEAPPERRFIFCTPLLEQVERVSNECADRHFITPDNTFTTKTEDIKVLIRANLNIATTHALFLLFDDETRELIRERNYTLIVDETMDVLSLVQITPYDAKTIIEEYCEALEDGQLVWMETNYDGRFEDLKEEIVAGNLFKYGNHCLVRMCKIETFEVFREVFLMTYLFNGQPCKAYFDFHGWDYKQWYIGGSSHDTYALTGTPVKYKYPNLKQLITVKHTFTRSTLETKRGAFSKKWYEENNNPETVEMVKLKKHLATFFKLYGKDGGSANMWTTFKDYRRQLQGTRYTRGFVPCNSKATNEFRHKTVLAYPINRFLNPNLVNFIARHGGKVKHSDFALSEMVQWVWRSAIRDGKPITIYIPSDRMYELFMNWLNSIEHSQTT